MISPSLSLLDHLSNSLRQTSTMLWEHISKSSTKVTNLSNPLNQGWKQLMSMEVDPNKVDPWNQSPPASNRRSTTSIFPGQSERIYHDQNCVTNFRRHSISFEPMPRISSSPSLYSSPQPMHLSSPIPSGQTLSSEPWLTLITSSQAVAQYPVTIETQKSSEQSNSNSVQQKLLNKLKCQEIGSLHGACMLK